MRHITAIPLFVALTATAQAESGRKGNDPAGGRSWQEVCREAERVPLPRPDPAAKVARDCDAEGLYDGVGGSPNVTAARACALKKWETSGDNDSLLDSAGVLAMIYANGAGVPRDLDIAIAYACKLGGAPAEMGGRIDHLLALKTKGPGKAPFDVCDDTTSGMMMGYCAERASTRATVARDAKIAALVRPLDGRHQAAFARLKKAKAAFVAAVTDNEVDTSGSGRNAFIVEAREAHEDAFLKTLEGALGGTLPAASKPALEAADKALNAAYAKVMGQKDDEMAGTVRKTGVKATQRLWIAYRDAFSAFVADTSTTPRQAALALTEQRTKDLAELAP